LIAASDSIDTERSFSCNKNQENFHVLFKWQNVAADYNAFRNISFGNSHEFCFGFIDAYSNRPKVVDNA